MTPYVTPDIADIRNDPEVGKSISLAVVVSDTVSTRTVESRVTDLGGEVVRVLPSDVIVVDLPQTALDELCEIESLKSISRDDRMEVQA